MQNFSKSLLDVADNLARASSAVKESFSNLDTSEDSTGAVPLLKTLLEGVDLTDKQLGEVLCLCIIIKNWLCSCVLVFFCTWIFLYFSWASYFYPVIHIAFWVIVLPKVGFSSILNRFIRSLESKSLIHWMRNSIVRDIMHFSKYPILQNHQELLLSL